jgi:hypothetical protein
MDKNAGIRKQQKEKGMVWRGVEFEQAYFVGLLDN